MNQTIFERYAGFAAVRNVVSTFYEYVLDDDVMAPYFAGVDMRTQIDHQSKFIPAVMGGPAHHRIRRWCSEVRLRHLRAGREHGSPDGIAC
jgi:truncated hemoglobin YjbI